MKSLTRRDALGNALGGAALLLPAAAWAADWPERTVRMIVPFAAGAGADTVGRVFAEEIYTARGYEPLKDSAPVATTGILTNVMVVSSANPARTVADVVAQARAKPDEL